MSALSDLQAKIVESMGRVADGAQSLREGDDSIEFANMGHMRQTLLALSDPNVQALINGSSVTPPDVYEPICW